MKDKEKVNSKKDTQAKGWAKDQKNVLINQVHILGYGKLDHLKWTRLQPSESGVGVAVSGWP